MKLDELPEAMFWCFTCVGGVGVWGVFDNHVLERCPACKGGNLSPVKFIPEVASESGTV